MIMYFKNKLFKNFSYLLIINITSLIIPFVSYPYLIRVFGSEEFGKILYIQSCSLLFLIIVDFGFNLSAVRDVSIFRDDKEKLDQLVSNVLAIKIFIVMLGALVLSFYLLFSNKNDIENKMYVLTYVYCVGNAIFIQWYYQGVEKMQIPAIISVIIKIVMLMMIFIFVRDKNDILEYIAIYSGSAFFIGLVSVLYAMCYCCFRLRVPNYKLMRSFFYESFPFFLSRFSGIFILRITPIIIGRYIGIQFVAYYDLAEKLVNMLLTPLNIINQVIYPNVAKTKNIALVMRVIKVIFPLCMICYIISFFVSPYFIEVFAGNEMLFSANIFQITSLLLPIASLNYLLGNCVLIVNGKVDEFNKSVFFGFVFYVLYMSCIYSFDFFDINFIVFGVVINSVFILLFRVFFILKTPLIINQINR
ncbi:oligosaccharide flippase family protein [Photobacterium damselae]